MSLKTEFLAQCTSSMDFGQSFIVIGGSLLSLWIWFMLYSRRVKGIPEWRRPRGRPPKNDTREADYYKEQLKHALIGGNPAVTFACVASLLVSVCTCIMAFLELSQINDGAFLAVQNWFSGIICRLTWYGATVFLEGRLLSWFIRLGNVIAPLVLVSISAFIDWLVSLYRNAVEKVNSHS